MKRIVTLCLTIFCVCLWTIVPAFATGVTDAVPQNISDSARSKIIESLASIEDQKEIHGLIDVSFPDLAVGNSIHAYEYLSDGFNELPYDIYPLTQNGDLKALAFIENDTEGAPAEIIVQLADDIAENIAHNESFALIYDNSNFYLYHGDQFTLITNTNSEIESRAALPLNTSSVDTDIIVCTKISNAQPLNYIAPVSTRASDYIDCDVAVVLQGKFDKLCWAASDACIGEYVTGKMHTAKSFAQTVFQSATDFNYAKNTDESIAALNKVYGLNYTRGDVPTSNKIITNLQSGYPIFAAFHSDTAGHACVIKGYKTSVGYINLMDPEVGIVKAFKDGNTFSYTSPYKGVKLTLFACGTRL